MSIKGLIQDGEGTKRTAGVSRDHAVKVNEIGLMSLSDMEDVGFEPLLRKKVYITNFSDLDDNIDLNVDGSASPKDFNILASADSLKTIKFVKFVFHDTQMSLGAAEGRRFASVAAAPGLTNGIRFFVSQGGVETDIFTNPIKQMVNFLNYSVDIVNEAGALGAGEDLLTISVKLCFAPINIVPGGIDKITVRVQDDISLLNFFNVYAFGSQEFM